MKSLMAAFFLFFIINSANPLNVYAASEHPSIQAVVDKYVPDILGSNQDKRERALAGLSTEMQTLWNKNHLSPNQETRKKLSELLINLYEGTTDKDFKIYRRLGVLGLVTKNADNQIGKKYVFEKFEHGTPKEREEISIYIGFRPFLTGSDVYEKIEDLQKRGIIEKKLELPLLARTDKDKALPKIINALKISTDKETVLSAARTLQNTYQKPEYYRYIIPAIKSAGLDERYDAYTKNGLFFIDRKLFADYIVSAHGDDQNLALEILQIKGGVPPEIIPILNEKIKDKNPEIRILATKLLYRAAESNPSHTSEIIETLKASEQRENAPEVKKTLQTTIEYAERVKGMHNSRPANKATPK